MKIIFLILAVIGGWNLWQQKPVTFYLIVSILFGPIIAGIFGFKLGFWIAQQGSIFCFVILIFVYVYKMNRLDHEYDMDEDQGKFVPDDNCFPDKESQD